jgi:hypothetical protein
MRSPEYQLRLDPEIEALARAYLLSRLDARTIRAAVAALDPGTAGGAATGTLTTAPSAPATTPPVAASTAPATAAASGKPRPVVFVPTSPQEAAAGDVLSALALVPEIDALATCAKDRASADLDRLSTGEQTLGIGTIATMVGATAVGVASRPAARELLSGRVIPSLVVPGLSFEFNAVGDNLMLGLHYDLGRLLGTAGFGPAATGLPPLSGPWSPMPERELLPPIQRTALGPDAGPASNVGHRVAVAAAGVPLSERVRHSAEDAIAADLAHVRIHTDAEADVLARAVDARAFTSGRDIFFRSGEFQPDTPDGARVLLHEAVHAIQQAAGLVHGKRLAGGVTISERDDRFEHEADEIADLGVRPARRG